MQTFPSLGWDASSGIQREEEVDGAWRPRAGGCGAEARSPRGGGEQGEKNGAPQARADKHLTFSLLFLLPGAGCWARPPCAF